MIDLVFWSFVVATVPIALALAARLASAIAAPLAPAEAPALAWHAPALAAGRGDRRTEGPRHAR